MQKIIVLIVSIMMPGQQPDINHAQQMRDAASCWDAAKEFTERDMTDEIRSHGAIGYKAACMYIEKPSEAN
jgi:hypothetical protein